MNCWSDHEGERLEKNILIVDSDSRQRLKIAKAVLQASEKEKTGVKIYKAVNTARAFVLLEKYDMDMLILNTDYQKAYAQEISGIRLVEELRLTEKYLFLPVIFLSKREGMRKYAYAELNCLGYQKCDFDSAILVRTIGKGLHYTTQRREERKFYLKEKQILYPVQIKDILYIEMQDRKLRFYLKDRSILKITERRLMDAKEKLGNGCLLQCSRETLVNRDYIEKIDGKNVILKNGTDLIRLNMGKSYRNSVRAFL